MNFDQYKNEPKPESWTGFPELMWEMGFEMDCGKSFKEYAENCGIKVKEPHSERERKRNNLYLLEHAEPLIIGNYLFSYWRYLTHWSYGYDKYEVDYLVRIISILEKKLTKYK